MIVLLFILFSISFSLFPAAISDGLSLEQREEARLFISTCFKELEQIQQKKRRKLKDKIEQAEQISEQILSADQINYRMYRDLEDRIEDYDEMLYTEELYELSLARPQAKLVVWSEAREVEARALQAYISLTDEWLEYKKNPSNIKAYEELHKRLILLAQVIVDTKGERAFVAGTHALSNKSDKDVNYDVDRVFFLTLYLLDKELVAEKALMSSSSY